MKRRAVWLRPDQRELVVAALKVFHANLGREARPVSVPRSQGAALNYTQDRTLECLALFVAAPPGAATPGDKP